MAGVLAGLGIAPLYPVVLDRLVRTAGLDPRRAAAVGALASGTAVLFAPVLLSVLARASRCGSGSWPRCPSC